DTGGLVEKRKVGLDLTRSSRPLHLDGDAPAVRQRGAMDLADRSRGDGPVVELGEELVDREAEILRDDLLDVRERKRTNVVLKPAQLGDDVRRQDVGPGRQQLAE